MVISLYYLEINVLLKLMFAKLREILRYIFTLLIYTFGIPSTEQGRLKIFLSHSTSTYADYCNLVERLGTNVKTSKISTAYLNSLRKLFRFVSMEILM